MLKLRDYQDEALRAIVREAKQGVRKQLVVLPTGAGKTILAAALSQVSSGKVLMLVHRDELAEQSVEKFGYAWPSEQIGVVKGARDEHDKRIVVGSIQTLQHKRRRERLNPSEFSLVICDEAHHAPSRQWTKVLEYLGLLPEADPGRLLLGITATPMRGDGIGLGHVFEKVVYRRTITDLVRAGYLADIKGIRVRTSVDLSKVKVRMGDFQAKDLSLAVDTPRRNELIVKAYRDYGEQRKAVVFTVDVDHARHIAEAFRDAGYRADWISGKLSLEERRARLKRFRDGELDVLANCQVLVEGWDEPSVGALIMARPTKSSSFYIQAVGRGLRPYPGKDYCVVIDMSDSVHDLCSIATLTKEGELPGGTYTADPEADRLVEKEEEEEIGDVKIVASPMDLLSRSKFKWRIESHRMVLEAGPGQEIILEEVGADRWSVTLRRGRERLSLAEQPLPVSYAQGVAEDYVRENSLENYAARDAKWRSRPATMKQVSLLVSLGIEPEPGLTREQAQAIIREALKRRALEDPDAPWRSDPASPKQIQWMHRHGFSVPEGFTKGDFSDLLESLRQRKAK